MSFAEFADSAGFTSANEDVDLSNATASIDKVGSLMVSAARDGGGYNGGVATAGGDGCGRGATGR
jgi:hypothetical protein